jgi:carbonic anhydrase/acetyltransferase-like protein (isoleucine patch superfamily)
MLYEFEGKKPHLHATVYTAPGVHIIGDVTIGEYSSIWFNSTLRGDLSTIRIGCYANIQDNCVVHVDTDLPTELGDYVLVGHNVILHGCRVGAASMIGMGAVLLDGAKVGERSMIGAGSLVKQYQEIPAGVLAVGSPARVIRELKQEEMDLIRINSLNYSKRGQAYRRDLHPL